MEQATRNKLRNVVTQCRKLLEESIAQQLEGQFGIRAGKKDAVQIEDEARMSHLSEEDKQYRRDLLDHLEHIKARSIKAKDSLDQLIREIAFTHLNRLCAYKMMEARDVYVGGQKFYEAVSRGVKSNGFLRYLGTEGHEEDERLFQTGNQELAYRHFLDWLGGRLSEEIGVLFNPNDPANRLYPRQTTLDEILDLLNDEELAGIWEQDETIGWVYQYFTPKELRDKARKESQAPRNSYELAFRNQFFTPRYVVEFLTDNTLGRIWYEMRKGDTKLKDQCRYMVHRPNEFFLDEGREPETLKSQDDLSQEELLKQPVQIPHRPKKDPRELKILDPACGSGHFLLYCFDLLLTIYEEAYDDSDLGPALQKDYPNLDNLRRDVPRLILAHNIHGIDIDQRASQIAALALWLRCQRVYQQIGLKQDRPKITRSNFVCAEPMPGEEQMLTEFVAQLEPQLLGQLVEVVFDKMKLAGEAGSLLKIEEEIRYAVAAAKKEWLADPVTVQRSLFDTDEPKAKQQSFDFSGISNDEFFEQAESKVVEALGHYAEKAQNGKRLQRRLFADDAMRGFAFVDICRKRFDVVLMNPPFGVPSKPSKSYIDSAFGVSKNDLFASFVDRGLRFLNIGGRLGAITSRTGCFLTSFRKWREEIVLGLSRPHVFADLGAGVLDAAVVETAAYCLERLPSDGLCTSESSIFFRLITEEHKSVRLLEATDSLRAGNKAPLSYLASPDSFGHVPGSPFCYWVSDAVRRLFTMLPPFDDEQNGRATRCGLGTLDDFRFLRLRWEVRAADIGTQWRVYYHGGVFSPFHDEFHCVVLWEQDGAVIKRYVEEKVGSASRKVQGEGRYFTQGFVFPRRTKGFSPKFMPEGGIFSTAGQAGFVPEDDLNWTIALLSSRICTFLLSLSQGRTGDAAQFEVGLVKRLPWPQPDRPTRDELSGLACEGYKNTVALCSWKETSHFFSLPALLQCDGESLADRCQKWMERTEQHRRRLSEVHNRIDEIAFELYGVSADEIDRATQVLECEGESEGHECDDNEQNGKQLENSNSILVGSLLSYVVGCSLGVWDIRNACEQSHIQGIPEPTAPLPRRTFGSLNFDTNSRSIIPDYPISLDSDGILVDDAEHRDDIVRSVRRVLEVIWKNRDEAIESEAFKILGVRTLRDYFRKPGTGGFWADHVKRYSKSRHKAPMYWLLQSSKKNYAIWLYYHRLDKDILFKALFNYVEPKIQREENRVGELRSQKSSASDTGTKKLDRDIEKQEDLLSELRDFADKLRKVADMHLEPDLSDGVVLTIAPLHELVPWKDAKKYWNELMDGKYEWSSIGSQLREKGLVK